VSVTQDAGAPDANPLDTAEVERLDVVGFLLQAQLDCLACPDDQFIEGTMPVYGNLEGPEQLRRGDRRRPARSLR
jgi:hypothetical protein